MLCLVADVFEEFSPRPTYSPSASPLPPDAALGRAFTAACRQQTPETTATLRHATIRMVRELKARSLPPEQVVIAIKEALVRFGGYHMPVCGERPSSASDDRQATAFRHLFTWSLDEYFGTT